jgi:hypothetical protein
MVYPDEIENRFKDYIDLKIESLVYEFMCTYIRGIKPDIKWKNEWVGELGAQGQEQEGCYKDILDKGHRG